MTPIPDKIEFKQVAPPLHWGAIQEATLVILQFDYAKTGSKSIPAVSIPVAGTGNTKAGAIAVMLRAAHERGLLPQALEAIFDALTIRELRAVRACPMTTGVQVNFDAAFKLATS